jgi:N-carbamoylputrescine amidase
MKVTVCELPNAWSESEEGWQRFARAVREEQSDLLLLPEMPFSRWLAGTKPVDRDRWRASAAAHDRRVASLADFATPIVIGTRPVVTGGRRYNQGFVWDAASGIRPAHTKYYLPDEDGFWEASWYHRGNGVFEPIQAGSVGIGFLICTELWFNTHARNYASQGIQLLVCPRATPRTSVGKWIAGGRTAAVVSGAFCLSSNFTGPCDDTMTFGGNGWIIEPEEGRVLGLTTSDTPLLTIDIDLTVADRAKTTYPRYVPD